jgi:hypothetical protein
MEKPVAEIESLSNHCINQLSAWHAAGYVRSEAETRQWLESQGVREPEVSRILTGFGF